MASLEYLEKIIGNNLLATKLATNINLYAGDFKDPENQPYVEFKLRKTVFKKRGPFIPLSKELTDLITERLKRNSGGIEGISYKLLKTGVIRLHFELNPITKIDSYEEEEFKERVFQTLNNGIESYLTRKKIPIPKKPRQRRE